MAAAASQHGVRSHAMANLALAASVLAGHLSRHSLQEVRAADLSALQTERSTIALCEVQIAQLRVMLASQAKPLEGMATAYMALQKAAISLGAPDGNWRYEDEGAFARATKTTTAFGHRLEALSSIFAERSKALEHQVSRRSILWSRLSRL